MIRSELQTFLSGVKTLECVYFLRLCDTALRFVVAVDARERIQS
jgi:hypothetical protein